MQFVCPSFAHKLGMYRRNSHPEHGQFTVSQQAHVDATTTTRGGGMSPLGNVNYVRPSHQRKPTGTGPLPTVNPPRKIPLDGTIDTDATLRHVCAGPSQTPPLPGDSLARGRPDAVNQHLSCIHLSGEVWFSHSIPTSNHGGIETEYGSTFNSQTTRTTTNIYCAPHLQ